MKRYFSEINWKRNLLKGIFAYGVLLCILFVMQRSLLYHPSGSYLTPEQQGISAQELHLPTADGQEALAWFQPPPEDSSGKVIVFFHGNAGGLNHGTVLLEQIRKAGFGYLALEYRGYPGYAGSISEQGIYADARATMEFLGAKFPSDDIVILGRSLGAGVAVQIATEYPAGLVALVSPFTTVADAAAPIYWYVPVQWMIRDRFDSYSKIEKVTAPLYVFHGDADVTVPLALGQKLFERANAPKEFFTLAGQGHNRLDMGFVLQKISDFTHTKPVGEILLMPQS